jgi:hypothetical protein
MSKPRNVSGDPRSTQTKKDIANSQTKKDIQVSHTTAKKEIQASHPQKKEIKVAHSHSAVIQDIKSRLSAQEMSLLAGKSNSSGTVHEEPMHPIHSKEPSATDKVLFD